MGADEFITVQMRLVDAARFSSEMRGTAAATREAGVAAETTGLAWEHAGRRSFLLAQAMFTLRRVMYAGTLALIASGAAAIKLGYNYDSAMQTARVAFSGFLPSAQAVNKELQLLYHIAAITPFQFKDITDAARRMMAFGFNVQDTNRYLVDITDMLSAMGQIGPAQLNRIVVALGHMNNLGRLTGQTLLQLARDGIPVYSILQKQLGLTSDQLHNIGKLGIPSSVAMAAIARGIEADPKYRGAGARIGTQTLPGILSTTKDYLAQIFGEIENRPFLGAQSFMARLNKGLSGAGPAFAKGGFTAMFASIDKGAGFNGKLLSGWQTFSSVMHDLWQLITKSLVPAFKDVFSILGGSISITRTFADIIHYLAANTTLLHYVLVPLIAAYVAYHSIILLNNVAGRVNILIETLSLKRMEERIVKSQLVLLWTRIQTAQQWLLNAAETAYIYVMIITSDLLVTLRAKMAAYVAALVLTTTWQRLAAAATTIMTAATWLFNAALDANPLVLLGLAIVGTIAALVYLEMRFHFVEKAFNGLKKLFEWAWNFFRTQWKWILLWMVAPFAGAVVLIIRHWGDLKRMFFSAAGTMSRVGRVMFNGLWEGFRWALDKIIGAWNALHFHFGGLKIAGHTLVPGFSIGLPHLPMLAMGGYVTGSGSAVVGERGPELLTLPRGAQVTPLPVSPGFKPQQIGGWGQEPVTFQLFLDTRQIAEAVFEYAGSRQARV